MPEGSSEMQCVNKKGEEFVEAAIVLPLFILTMLSMITVAVYLFRYEIIQSKAHTELARKAAGSEQVFGIKTENASYSIRSRGLFSKALSKEKTLKMYVINQSEAVMLGELAE